MMITTVMIIMVARLTYVAVSPISVSFMKLLITAVAMASVKQERVSLVFQTVARLQSNLLHFARRIVIHSMGS